MAENLQCPSCSKSRTTRVGRPRNTDEGPRQIIFCEECNSTEFVYLETAPAPKQFGIVRIIKGRFSAGQPAYCVAEGTIFADELSQKPGDEVLRESAVDLVQFDASRLSKPPDRELDVRDPRFEDTQEIPVPVLVGAGR